LGNFIPDKKWDLAVHLFGQGKSHREIAEKLNIAKYTAYKIYRSLFEAAEELNCPCVIPFKRKGGYWDHKRLLK